ncbi:MAG: tRNA (cytidine(34)-2'-O)-methyltransferase [Bdellovibrionota bacterium]
MGRTINTQIKGEDRRPSNFLERNSSDSDDKSKYASHPEGLKIVLLRPRIPQNTGSVARMCAATGCSLDIVEPFFEIDDKKLKRAGLDYWPYLDVFTYKSIGEWLEARKEHARWFVEINAPQSYTDVTYAKADMLIFGDEQDGVPEEWLKKEPSRHVAIPQKNVRSLNLATSVGIVTYEALRQLDWYSTQAPLTK